MTAARPDTWMPLYWGDYLRDTGHLSAAEHGAYLLLIGHYWTTGKRLPDNDTMLARVARMTAKEWKAARPIIAPFFKIEDGLWGHGRIDAEMQKWVDLINGKSKAGKASAKARAEQKAQQMMQQNVNTRSTDDATEQPTKHPTKINPSPSPSPSPREDVAVVATRDGSEFHRVGSLVLEAMGVAGDPRWLGNYAPVAPWLAAGYDPELDILPTVRRLTAALGHPAKSLNYFTEAIAKAHHERLTELPAFLDRRTDHGKRINRAPSILESGLEAQAIVARAAEV